MFDLNKNNWPEHQFSEIAEQISERIDPAESNAEIYVGLEHIEPNSIHIKEHGKPSDVKGTKLKVYKGDIIFGKRRAYQRKAAIADFDGICSAHAMVLRAKPKVMIPELFPFFLHSDAFMNRAIDISEGSLSPTIKWKILAKQKFIIPPLDEQKKLADLLWAGDKLKQVYKNAYEKIKQLRKINLNLLLKSENDKKNLDKLPLKIISGLWKGSSADQREITVIRNTEFGEFGIIDFSNPERITVDSKKFAEKKLLPGDIILEMSGGSPAQPVGRVVFFNSVDGNYSFSNFTKVIRVENKESILNKYLFIILLAIYELGLTERLQKKTTGIRNLDFDLYKAIKFSVPKIEIQEKIISDYENIEGIRINADKQIQNTQLIMKRILDLIFT